MLELIAQNDALVAAHVNLKLLADTYRQAYEEALEHYKPREERVTKLVLDNERSWDLLCEKLEAAEKQNALDVQIKARLCRESNSLHDRVREAEKRIAELENDEVLQRLANAEHQLHMAELAKHNLKASRKAQFKKRKAAEARIAELESRTLRVNMPALRNTEMMSDLAWNSAIDQCFDALIKAADEAGINLETEGK